MLPLSDGVPARRFPVVNVLLIVANFAVFFLYELPNLNAAVYQLIEADFGLFNASANGGGVAFFAHVGGFIFGVLIARILIGAGRIAPQER